MLTESLTCFIKFQSALPLYPCTLVLGWIAMALAPAFSIILATSTQLIVLLSQPALIFTVTGIATVLTTEDTISYIFSGFLSF